MTSPVHGKVEVSTPVPQQQPSRLSTKKIVDSAKLSLKSLGSMFGSSKPQLSMTLRPVVIHTQAVRKVNLTTTIPEEKEPPITLIPAGIPEVRPHMIAFQAFTRKASELEHAVPEALAANKTAEWNDDEIGDLEGLFHEVVAAMHKRQELFQDYRVEFSDWQHVVLGRKDQKLYALLLSIRKKLKEVDPWSLL